MEPVTEARVKYWGLCGHEAERGVSVPGVPVCPEVVCTPSLSKRTGTEGPLVFMKSKS